MDVVADTMALEFKETGSLLSSSNSVFKVFYELNTSREDYATRFYEAFVKTMQEGHPLF